MNTETARGVLFADAQQRVIFVDSDLQKMLHISKVDLGRFIGEPVHELLGITLETYNEITKRARQHKQADTETLALQDQVGNLLNVTVDFIVNSDDSGHFMGIDFTFHHASQTPIAFENSILVISDKMAEQIVRYYFKRQIRELHEVMTHVGGVRLGQYLITAINATAEQNGWDVEVNQNTVEIHKDTLPFDAYQGLLSKAASYASTAIGSKIVNKRITEIDAETNPKTFDYIQPNWFHQLS